MATKNQKIHGIIHSASLAAAAVGAGLAQLPGITGSTASMDWSPSVEDLTDIAYYSILRNGTEIRKTSSNYFNDSGILVGSFYSYKAVPVNAATLSNTTCLTHTVSPNPNLVLHMNKLYPDAALSWTSGGLTQFNVNRGVNAWLLPFLRQKTSTSDSDAGVLLLSSSYFYSIDEPIP